MWTESGHTQGHAILTITSKVSTFVPRGPGSNYNARRLEKRDTLGAASATLTIAVGNILVKSSSVHKPGLLTLGQRQILARWRMLWSLPSERLTNGFAY